MKHKIFHATGPSDSTFAALHIREKGFQKHCFLLVKLLGLIDWTKISKKCPCPVLDWPT
jgi:hypothetical protein